MLQMVSAAGMAVSDRANIWKNQTDVVGAHRVAAVSWCQNSRLKGFLVVKEVFETWSVAEDSDA